MSYEIYYDADHRAPPSGASLWLEENSIEFTFPTISFVADARRYEVPGGTVSFPKGEHGQKEVLRLLMRFRDLWRPDNQSALIQYAKSFEIK